MLIKSRGRRTRSAMRYTLAARKGRQFILWGIVELERSSNMAENGDLEALSK